MRELRIENNVVRIKGNTEKIYEIFEKKKTVNLKKLRELSGVNYNSIRSTVRRLRDYGLIERTNRGTYSIIAL